MSAPRAVREPKQQRTRDAWAQILDVGLELFTEGGVAALTVSEVCRRTGTSPPSLYARVDGRRGLISAVYEVAMLRLRDHEHLIHEAAARETTPRSRVAAVVDATAELFARNRQLMRSVVAAGPLDDAVRTRGVEETQRFIGIVADALDIEETAAGDVASTVFASLVMVTTQGLGYAAPGAETEESFRERLIRVAVARAFSS